MRFFSFLLYMINYYSSLNLAETSAAELCKPPELYEGQYIKDYLLSNVLSKDPFIGEPVIERKGYLEFFRPDDHGLEIRDIVVSSDEGVSYIIDRLRVLKTAMDVDFLVSKNIVTGCVLTENRAVLFLNNLKCTLKMHLADKCGTQMPGNLLRLLHLSLSLVKAVKRLMGLGFNHRRLSRSNIYIGDGDNEVLFSRFDLEELEKPEPVQQPSTMMRAIAKIPLIGAAVAGANHDVSDKGNNFTSIALLIMKIFSTNFKPKVRSIIYMEDIMGVCGLKENPVYYLKFMYCKYLNPHILKIIGMKDQNLRKVKKRVSEFRAQVKKALSAIEKIKDKPITSDFYELGPRSRFAPKIQEMNAARVLTVGEVEPQTDFANILFSALKDQQDVTLDPYRLTRFADSSIFYKGAKSKKGIGLDKKWEERLMYSKMNKVDPAYSSDSSEFDLTSFIKSRYRLLI